jgi:large subunit ribosomal protein L22
MSKKKRDRALSDTEAMAVARNLRVSPQKLNLLAQLIRGKKVATALADLEFSRKRIARDVRKCLESAIANAENNHDLDVDDLVVREASVGKNLVMKRFHARARGNSGGIEKFFSQITIVVEEQREAEKKGKKAAPKAEDEGEARASAKKASAKKSSGKKAPARKSVAKKSAKAKEKA